MNSEAHREVLFKVLNRAHVNHDISTDKLGGIINNIMIDNFISFSDQEVPIEGRGHTRPLHISVMCKDFVIGRVLIDNGASLNVMTKRTLSKLPVGDAILGPSSTVVKAFDGARRDVVGEIELPIKIGPCIFKVLFQVMDINPSFSCLLGRPWIHSAGAILSSLHQKVKFITGGRLITVMGEEDTLVSQLSDAPYVEVDSEALEASFRALEIANASSIEKGHPMLNPRPSNASIMMAKFMLRKGFQPGKGLGRMENTLVLPSNSGRVGLGYNPSNCREGASEDKKGGMAQLGTFMYKGRKVPIPHISQSFISTCFIKPDTIAMVEDGQLESDLELVSDNESITNDNFNNHLPNFDHPINQAEEDNDEEWEASPELLRLVEQESREIQPHEELVELINLGSEEDKKEIRVGTIMDTSERMKLIELLHEYKDVFAWSYEEMPGLDRNLVEHKLPLKLDSKPVKKKLRRMKPEISLRLKKRYRSGWRQSS
ncbi:hypothetical protein Lal_00044314 [Lupinus albus]|nr:hypothetical protein Lal_00044314 [Lupinus albus]